MRKKLHSSRKSGTVGDSNVSKVPYKMDNLFYEKFGMSCDEVMLALDKNYTLSIDIVT